ncbi:MAG: ArsR family transcriptional regulator [Candidatus Baltobacteraceae bacterium]
MCVCNFADALPLNQPTVSHHLRVQREAELVTCERRANGEQSHDLLTRPDPLVDRLAAFRIIIP